MKFSFPVAAVVLFAGSAWGQSSQWFYQPLGQAQQFLQLTDSQLQSILTNNTSYNQFAMTKQSRVSQLQSEIAVETAKDPLDPMALGVRYAEIAAVCREMTDQALIYQKKNTDILTEPQRAKLQVLQDALRLNSVISDAQSGNLIGSFSYGPPFFTSTSGTTTISNFGMGSVSGCYLPFLVVPANGSVLPAGRVSGAAVNPVKRDGVVNRWFDTTQFVTAVQR